MAATSLVVPRTPLGRRLATGYLAVVLASLAFVAWDTLQGGPANPSFAGIWPLLLTAPTSLLLDLLLMAIGGGEPFGGLPEWVHGQGTWLGLFALLVLVSAAVNIALVTLVARAVGTAARDGRSTS